MPANRDQGPASFLTLTVVSTMLLAAGMSIETGTAEAKGGRGGVQYTGTATVAGSWKASDSSSECTSSSEGNWTYSGTYWPMRLEPKEYASFDARTRAAGGGDSWTDCILGESGTCNILAEPAVSTQHLADEDINFKIKKGGWEVEFLGYGNLHCDSNAYGPGGIWPDLSEYPGSPHGFLPVSKLGDAKIIVPIKGEYARDTPYLSDHRSISGTLTMTRVGGLSADPGGPYTVQRGGRVKLDGSGSTERARIRSYRWTFGKVDCPSGASPDVAGDASKSGRRAAVVALCSMRVKLTVDDGNDTDSKSTTITVKPRPPRRIPFTQSPHVDSRTFPFDHAAFVFGYNRCSVEWADSHDQDLADHWLHPGPDPDGSRGAVTMREVSDNGGPFDGDWYVTGNRLEVTRTMIVNRKLRPGGAVYDENTDPAHLGEMQNLLAGTLDHERIHGELAAAKLSESRLPQELEQAMSSSRERLLDRTAFLIRDAEGKLKAASSDAKVKARMREKWGGTTATIRLPSGGQETFTVASIGGD